MDRNTPISPPEEHRLPSWDSEHSLPSWDAEFSEPAAPGEYALPAPEESGRVPEDTGDSGRIRRLKKMLRFMAATVAVGGIALTAAPVPLEVVDIPSYIEIECCAVTPEEPEALRFRYMDYRSLYEEAPTYSEEDFRFYLVDPEGQETELTRRKDPYLYRAAYCPEDEDIRDAAYSEVESPGSYFSLNLGTEMWRADIGPWKPGSQLKIVCAYESDGVVKRMTSVQEIVMTPREPDITVTAEALAQTDGGDGVRFIATMHPQDGEESAFVFTDQALSRMGFCTRWYDASGVPLGEGWCFAVPSDREPPFPDAYRIGQDFVFYYEGPVRRAADDSAAAYYSLELILIEESTGWPYRLESPLLPTGATAVPQLSPLPEIQDMTAAPLEETPVPKATPEPVPEKRELVIESGKDAFDFRFRLADSDWSVSEGDVVVLGSPSGTESMAIFSVDGGAALTQEALDSLLLYRFQQEVEANASDWIQIQMSGSGPYDRPVNGYPGRALDYEIHMGTQVFKCQYVSWAVDSRLYMLNLQAFAEDHEHACGVLEELLSSFAPAS